MEKHNLEILNTFSLERMPSLAVATLGALELFSDVRLPSLEDIAYARPLVLGSGNAFATGALLFEERCPFLANESNYEKQAARAMAFGADGAIVVSASGGKHAGEILAHLATLNLPTTLITAQAGHTHTHLPRDVSVVVFPKNREPYTYNTSSYLGMLLAKTGESTQMIEEHLRTRVAAALPADLGRFKAYTLLVPARASGMTGMFLTKFHELFGATITGRAFTLEEAKHAKTVVPSEDELFVSLGEAQEWFGYPDRRVTVPLPEEADIAALMSVGYFVIGRIQEAHPPYFQKQVAKYCSQASVIFKENINPIVEA